MIGALNPLNPQLYSGGVSSYSPKLLKESYMGDFIVDYYKGLLWGIRGL